MLSAQKKSNLAMRFRGLLPVVVDVETSGLNPLTDALLEIALVPVTLKAGIFSTMPASHFHVEPFVGANMDPQSLKITGIDPGYPLRFAIPECQVLHLIFIIFEELLKQTRCQRIVLVGHNAWFDLAFIKAAVKRCHLKRTPFHSFTTFDTATLSGALLGETVLARALKSANIPFDVNQAHSALYDAIQTAELFCYLLNALQRL